MIKILKNLKWNIYRYSIIFYERYITKMRRIILDVEKRHGALYYRFNRSIKPLENLFNARTKRVVVVGEKNAEGFYHISPMFENDFDMPKKGDTMILSDYWIAYKGDIDDETQF